MSDLADLKKKDLIQVMVDAGWSQADIDWLAKRNNAEGLRVVIRNDRALEIIANEAKKAGQERQG